MVGQQSSDVDDWDSLLNVEERYLERGYAAGARTP